LDEQVDEWVEVIVGKVTAVIRCRQCGYINRNEDYGDQRLDTRVFLHCPQCNVNRYHTVIQKIMEVKGLPVPEVDIEAIVEEATKKIEKELKLKEKV